MVKFASWQCRLSEVQALYFDAVAPVLSEIVLRLSFKPDFPATAECLVTNTPPYPGICPGCR